MYILSLVLGVILAWAIIKRTSNYLPHAVNGYPLSELNKRPVLVFPDMKNKLKAPVEATKSLLAKTRVMMPFGPVPTNVVTPSLVDKPVYKFDDLKQGAFNDRVARLGPSSATNANTPPAVQIMFENAPEF